MVNKFRVLLIFFLYLSILLCIPPIASAADEIHIIYDQAELRDGFRYWYGKGVLTTGASENFSIDIGDMDIIAFTGAIPTRREGDRINVMNVEEDKFEAAFRAPKPEGHGLYTILFKLPEISGSEDKKVRIEIENGEKVLFSNVDFNSHKEGDYLILEAKTNERILNLRYVTKFAYMLFADAFVGGFFILILLLYLTIKRKEVRKILHMNISDTKGRIKSSIGLKEEKGGYEILFENPFSTKENKHSFRIPFWFLSAAIIIFLFTVFFFAITSPLEKVWDSLGIFKIIIALFAILFAVLSGLLILSAKSYKSLSLRFGVVGGGIVGAMFGYLGLFAVVLAVTTCLLIYVLSVLLLEEGE